LDQEDEIRECLKIYGVVVIRDIYTPQECEDTKTELFNIFEFQSNKQFLRNDVSTWDNWPADGISKYGQPTRAPIFTRQILMNRQNPRLYKSFCILMGSEDLLVSHDRACLFRPTKNVQFLDGSYQDMKHWRTGYNIHLDINPYHFMEESPIIYNQRWHDLTYGYKLNNFINENNIAHKNSGLHLQCVVNLHDNLEEDGGFCCVPGFHNDFESWYYGNQTTLCKIATSPSVGFSSKQHWLNKYAQRISMRAGSVVIWDSRLPHGSIPNNSSNMRVAQFIKLFLRSDIPSEEIIINRRETVKREIEAAKFKPDLTPLGTKLFGLEEPNISVGKEDNNTNKKRKNENNSRIQGNKW